MRNLFFICMLMLLGFFGSAQRISPEEYIATYKDLAMREMQRSGVPAAITLAQGIFESESGNSNLVKESNNHFGIKCKPEWMGDRVYHDDDLKGECFRKYDSAALSYADHSDFLRTRANYTSLFDLDPADYKSWAYGLKKAGYATNPRYPQLVIKVIEQYRLNDYSLMVLNRPLGDSAYTSSFASKTYKTIRNEVKSVVTADDLKKIKTTKHLGLKAVFAEKGMSLLAIATKYNIALVDLLEYNDLLEDGLMDEAGWIYLQNKKAEGDKVKHIVKDGETTYSIAQEHAIQLSYLLAYNGLEETSNLNAGQTIYLKYSEEAIPDAPDQTATYHKVKANETLKSIAEKYKVSIADLKEWNHLTTEKIKPGQNIIILK